jgi:uncharacterized protein YhaN
MIIDRFGGVSHFPISGLVPGLNVIVGPNEAGKSTVLEFIRSIFFGFKRRSARPDDNSYQTPDGSLRQGRLLVRTSHGTRLRVERCEQIRRKEGILTITDEQGNILTEAALPILRAGMDRGFFEALFAFDLDMLRRLDRDSLRSKIIGTALGSVAVNPLEVRKQVEQRLGGLEKKSPKDERTLHGIGSGLADVSQQLKTLREMPRHYGELKDRFELTNRRREEISVRVRETESRLEKINLLLGKEWECTRLQAIEPRITALEATKDFPVNGAADLDRLLEKRAGSQEIKMELDSELERVQQQMDSIHPDQVILDHADAIQVLARQAQILTPRPAELQRLYAEIDLASRNLDAAIAEMGAGWNRERVAASDPSLVLDETVSRFADSWKAESEKIRELHRSLETVEETCRRIEEKIVASRATIDDLGPSCEGFLTPRQRDLIARWKEQESEAAHLRERLADKNAALERLSHENDRVQRTYEALDSQRGRELSWGLVCVAAAMLILGGAGMLIVAKGSAGLNMALLLVSGFFLVALAPLLIGWNFVAVRATRALVGIRREALSAEMGRISAEIGDLSREQSDMVAAIKEANRLMREIAADVFRDPDADRRAVLAAETWSASAEEAVRRRQSLEETVLAAQRDLEVEQRRTTQIQDELTRAVDRFNSLDQEWKKLLAHHGLDQGMEPETARELIRRLSALKKEQRDLTEQEQRLAAITQEWTEFTNHAGALAHKMKRPHDPQISPVDVVARWSRAEQEARDAEASRRALKEKLDDLEARVRREQQKIAQTNNELTDLLARAGVGDAESFRELAKQHATYQDLEKERRSLVQTLMAGLKCADKAGMRSLIQNQDWERNHTTAARLQEDLDRLRHESEELARESGSLSQEIATLEALEEVEALSAEKERLIACLKEKAREWLVLRLASELLERTILVYESEKQPKVMERCSALFKNVTGGAFTAVRVPMDGSGIKVERADRSILGQGLLSRGTLEQLYLCLRMAHLDVYHRDESTVPLVMDDVMVNFDPERASRTAEVLTRFSEDTGIQVLFFTCHSHTADLFPRDVHRFELSQGEGIDF